LQTTESAFARLEKQPENLIYSRPYQQLLCARRMAPFVAEIQVISALFRAS
jgi:hypothetical protein